MTRRPGRGRRGQRGLLVMRVAGLPLASMEGLSSRLDERLVALNLSSAMLADARADLTEALHRAIPAAPAERRPALLALKRDCHNGRSLRPHCGGSGWVHVEELAGPLTRRVLELESEAEAGRAAFAAAYDDEVRRQRLHLAALLEEPSLRAGLAFASPLVAGRAARLPAKNPDEYGPRERRLVTTLLRYASRSALKLSPFSTLTQVGLAEVGAGWRPLLLTGADWERRSLVRVRRYVLDRFVDLLAEYPPWRRRLVVALNDSAPARDGERVLFRRRSHWSPDEARGGVRYHEEALVRVRLRGPCVDAVRELLATGSWTYEELLAELARRLGQPSADGESRAAVDRLIDLGYLNLLPPWHSDAGRLEASMSRALRRLLPDPGLARCVELLERLVALEDACASGSEALPALDQLAELIERLTREAAQLAGLAADVGMDGPLRQIYQDVWCAPRGAPRAALARLGRGGLRQALRSVAPLMRYARLWDRRQDFLYTLGDVLRRSHGDDCKVPVLEAFDAVQPIWRGLVQAQVQARRAGRFWRDTYNPLELPVLHELAAWRAAAQAGLDQCRHDGPEGRRVSVEGFEALLRPIPRRFTRSHGGVCLFLQPADETGAVWVLNRLKEGTGRFASRYTPVAPPALARRYTAGLTRRGRLTLEGERVELLDVQCIQGDTLNVHLPQTPKVLTLDGSSVSLPPERRLSLADLVVTLGRQGCPQLRDRSGQRYLPVYLGVAYHDYLPTTVKFLCAFGPSEMAAVFPDALEREADGVRYGERTLIGNVVLQRRTWRVPTAELRGLFSAATEAQGFAWLQDWRQRRRLPERVFLVERVPHPFLDSLYKPQYVDLSSPLFVALLRAALAGSPPALTFVEMLPHPEAFPRDARGRRWAVEILADSASLAPAHRPPFRQRAARGHRVGSGAEPGS